MSILTLFRASTGEGWNGIMDDMYRIRGPNFICNNNITHYDDYEFYNKTESGCGKIFAYPYMITFQFVFAIVFLNFFVAVIIEGFDETAVYEDANLS